MGEPISLSMRGVPSTVHTPHNPKTNSTQNAAQTSLNSPRLTSRFLPSNLLFVKVGFGGEDSFEILPIVIRPESAEKNTVDGIDKITWGVEGAAALGGLGLLLGKDDDLSHWTGTFLIATAGTNAILEWIDRKHDLAHDHRLPRLAMSVVAGLLVSNLVVIGFGNFDPGGVGGNPGRNPTTGWGP